MNCNQCKITCFYIRGTLISNIILDNLTLNQSTVYMTLTLSKGDRNDLITPGAKQVWGALRALFGLTMQMSSLEPFHQN